MPGTLSTDSEFLAPPIHTEELIDEITACPACEDVRIRSRLVGAVCYQHFLKARKDAAEFFDVPDEDD